MKTRVFMVAAALALGAPAAQYNVRLISRYRTKSGKVRRVVTRRNLSVACS